MAYIYLGDLSVEQIEQRTGLTFSDEDKAHMKEHRQHEVNSKKIEKGHWHCFDIPFAIMTGDKETAEQYREMLSKYDWSKCRESLQICWGGE